MIPRPPFTYIPALPNIWLVHFADETTEADVLQYAEMVTAWRIDQIGRSRPVTAINGPLDDWREEIGILLPDGRVQACDYAFRSLGEWIELMQRALDTGEDVGRVQMLARLERAKP